VSLKHAFGLLDHAPERSIWFVAETDADVAAAHRLATNIGDKHGRLALYISGPDAPSPLTLQPRPIRLKLALKLALSQLRCRAVVLPPRPSRFSIALASAAAKGIPVLFLPRLNIDSILFISQLPHILSKNLSNTTVNPWSQDIAKRLNSPIASLDALRPALNNPKTILCLGSGPSSNEDAAVAAVEAADVIFRVKHRWLKEGRIHHADVVFIGTVESARQVPNAILLSPDTTTAYRVAWSALLRGRRIRYGIVEALTPSFHTRDKSGARMTNGAAMLALAIAMKFERLIIAGIDLYSHPFGAYPGTPETANAYAPAHDREFERTHTLAMLQQQTAQSGPQSLTVIGPLHDIAIQAGIALNDGGNGKSETAP
jgi:hypothetical protein